MKLLIMLFSITIGICNDAVIEKIENAAGITTAVVLVEQQCAARTLVIISSVSTDDKGQKETLAHYVGWGEDTASARLDAVVDAVSKNVESRLTASYILAGRK